MTLVSFKPPAAVTPMSVPAKPRFQLLTLEDLKSLPEPEWLMKGLFRAESQVFLYGPSGNFKSFVALNMALCIATGRPFHGRPVKKGPVVYLVSEGGRGACRRVLAWMQHNKATEEELGAAFFLLDAVQMTQKEDVEAFLKELDGMTLKPLLIVLDTFARSFVGGEENSATEVGVWIDASRKVQVATGATVMAVHHTGKTGGSERGSSALRGAAESMIFVERNGDSVDISCEKQKDDEAFKSFRLKTERVVLGTDEEGEEVTSLVLVDAAGKDGEPSGLLKPLSDALRKSLEMLKTFPHHETTSGEWRKALGETESTFHRHRAELVNRGLVENVAGASGRYRAVGTPTELSEDSHDTGPTRATTTPTTP